MKEQSENRGLSPINDVLLSGGGNDILLGGGGDDLMLADQGSGTVMQDWTVTRQVTGTDYNYITTNAALNPIADSGDTIMYGQSGNDWLDGGDDWMSAANDLEGRVAA